MTIRARYYVHSVEFRGGEPGEPDVLRLYKLRACSMTYTETPKGTVSALPYGELTISLADPLARLKVGHYYYLDLIEAPK